MELEDEEDSLVLDQQPILPQDAMISMLSQISQGLRVREGPRQVPKPNPQVPKYPPAISTNDFLEKIKILAKEKRNQRKISETEKSLDWKNMLVKAGITIVCIGSLYFVGQYAFPYFFGENPVDRRIGLRDIELGGE